jgi:outer membrane assembly lipoprotein YfiO
VTSPRGITIGGVLTRCALSIALLGALPVCADAAVWEFSGGRWTQVQAPASRPATDPTLDKIDALLDQHNHLEARKLALAWEKTHKTSPLRDRVLFQIARAYYEYGDRTRAFFHLDELMDTYPESPFFYRALDLQYQIADAYLNGYKRRLFGIPCVDASDDGIEMMYRIQQRSPGSPLAEKALLRTADYYFSQATYDLAGDAYLSYVRSYPRSPEVPRARLRAAYSSLAQFRGLRYDATALRDARTQLESLINDYPKLAADENLRDMIDRIDVTFARKNLVHADFYDRTHHPIGAAYLYEFVVRTYPQTPEADTAHAELTKLPRDAVRAVSSFHAPMAPPTTGATP